MDKETRRVETREKVQWKQIVNCRKIEILQFTLNVYVWMEAQRNRVRERSELR